MKNRQLVSKTLVLLAGGAGSRLKSFLQSDENIKCLSLFAGRTFLDFLLDQAQDAGFEKVIILAGANRAAISDVAHKTQRKLQIVFPDEQSPLGTGGALKLVEPHLTEASFFLSNADTFFAVNPFIEIGKLDLSCLTNSDVWGCFFVSDLSRSESPRYRPGEQVSSAEVASQTLYGLGDLTYIGIAHLRAEFLSRWSSLGLSAKASLEADVFPSLQKRAVLVNTNLDFIDFGTGSGYEEMIELVRHRGHL